MVIRGRGWEVSRWPQRPAGWAETEGKRAPDRGTRPGRSRLSARQGGHCEVKECDKNKSLVFILKE